MTDSSSAARPPSDAQIGASSTAPISEWTAAAARAYGRQHGAYHLELRAAADNIDIAALLGIGTLDLLDDAVWSDTPPAAPPAAPAAPAGPPGRCTVCAAPLDHPRARYKCRRCVVAAVDRAGDSRVWTTSWQPPSWCERGAVDNRFDAERRAQLAALEDDDTAPSEEQPGDTPQYRARVAALKEWIDSGDGADHPDEQSTVGAGERLALRHRRLAARTANNRASLAGLKPHAFDDITAAELEALPRYWESAGDRTRPPKWPWADPFPTSPTVNAHDTRYAAEQRRVEQGTPHDLKLAARRSLRRRALTELRLAREFDADRAADDKDRR